MHQPVDSVHFFVTMCPAGGGHQVAFLLGPFETFSEANGRVARGRGLACAANPYHWFDAFGVASLPDHLRPHVHFAGADT